MTAHHRGDRFYSVSPGKLQRKGKKKSSEKWDRMRVVTTYYLKYPVFNPKLWDIQGSRKVWWIFREKKKKQSTETNSKRAQRPLSIYYKYVQ